jgi:oligopeptide/dipeptide ABC transporter ATP-binding protein
VNSGGPGVLWAPVWDRIDDDFDQHLEEIRNFLRCPTVSASDDDMLAGAEYVAALIEGAGGSADIIPTAGHPAVLGRISKVMAPGSCATECTTCSRPISLDGARAGLRPPERFFLGYPHELSGGQRQRVVIAAATALDPRVLVADEPVSMLDASVRGEILDLLVRLKDEVGMTLVLITHDLAFAWALADRVAIMYLGKIVELGPAQTVLTEPLHPYTKSLLAVTPEVGRRRTHKVLRGEPPDPAHIPPGCRFHPRCPVVRSGEAGSQEPRCLGEPGSRGAYTWP